jgi:ribonuclease P protein component
MRERSELTLRKQKDFSRVYKKGKSKGSSYVVVLYRKNGLDHTRTAFVSSKKVGNSVKRNRSRRLMKEAYRSFEDRVAKGYDIVFVARATINDHKEAEVEKCMRYALKGCDLLEKHQ